MAYSNLKRLGMKRSVWRRYGLGGASTLVWIAAALSLLPLSTTLRSESVSGGVGKLDAKISTPEARALEAKILALSEPSSRPPTSFQPIVITEAEANAYLRDHGPEFFPPGVRDPRIQIRPDEVLGAAEVDFDQLDQARANTDNTGAQIIAWVFKGRQKVTATGKLDTANGQGRVTIENVAVGATAIPDWLVQWVLANYMQKRFNLDLSKAFVLPDHVTRIELAAGQATFVRSLSKGR